MLDPLQLNRAAHLSWHCAQAQPVTCLRSQGCVLICSSAIRSCGAFCRQREIRSWTSRDTCRHHFHMLDASKARFHALHSLICCVLRHGRPDLMPARNTTMTMCVQVLCSLFAVAKEHRAPAVTLGTSSPPLICVPRCPANLALQRGACRTAFRSTECQGTRCQRASHGQSDPASLAPAAHHKVAAAFMRTPLVQAWT